jgi:hypothetical protein
MHCPVENCAHVMKAEADSDDAAVKMLIEAGDNHFADVGHPMETQMTKEYMKKES